jgi:hypothetical protein
MVSYLLNINCNRNARKKMLGEVERAMRYLKYLCLLIVYVLSYWIGFVMYKLALWVIWKERLEGDFNATVLWSALAYIPVGLIYLLVCAVIKHKTKHPYLRFLLYPVCCALVFVIPTAFIILMNGGGSFFSPEAQLFNILFVSTGVTFGLGFSLVSIVFDKSK